MSAPQYLGPASAQAAPSLTTILKDQITNPAYREGNLKYVRFWKKLRRFGGLTFLIASLKRSLSLLSESPLPDQD